MPQSGTTTQRGYGADHRRERKRWEPIVNRGEGYCHAKRCLHVTRWINPEARWHLGHNDDRTAWTGPEHEDCNTTDGARRGNQARRHHPTPDKPRQPHGW